MAVTIARVEKDFVEGETVRHLGTQRLAIVVGERVLTERVIGRLGMTTHRLDVKMHGDTRVRTFHANLFEPLAG
jgi:hypothetical protein